MIAGWLKREAGMLTAAMPLVGRCREKGAVAGQTRVPEVASSTGLPATYTKKLTTGQFGRPARRSLAAVGLFQSRYAHPVILDGGTVEGAVEFGGERGGRLGVDGCDVRAVWSKGCTVSERGGGAGDAQHGDRMVTRARHPLPEPHLRRVWHVEPPVPRGILRGGSHPPTAAGPSSRETQPSPG
jgi:hypothetical protein